MAKTVLIVEDSETVALLQVTLLEKGGYDVRHAATGAEGLRLVSEWVPDILVLDITLPDMDGLDILKKIQTSRPETRPDVLVISGHDDPEVTFASLRAGAQGLEPYRAVLLAIAGWLAVAALAFRFLPASPLLRRP